jgi:hypothetical protein
MTDFENELRDLFREKAGEAPLATPSLPASAPRQVLRRGRLHQVGTVLGSAAVVVALIVGSVAGLTRILGQGKDDQVGHSDYDVFQRTATVEAFTVGSPSDWFLVNAWPLSMQIAVEGSSGSSSKCVSVPSGEPVECESSPGEPSSTPLPVPHGLPMLQLSNIDLGLATNVCADGVPGDGAALYVAFDYEGAIQGFADPSGQEFPPGVGLPPQGDGPCGPGRYAFFRVNGEPFFAWIGVGSNVSDEDRETVETSYEMMSAIPEWELSPPDETTPAYVIAGGALDNGDPWRLELRPGDRSPELFLEGIDRSLLGVDAGRGFDTTVPEVPIGFCCASTDGLSDATFLDVTFGFVRKDASGVELQVREGDELTGQILPGTIVPVPPSLGSFDFDLFFIPGTAGLAGDVVPIGIDGTEEPPTVAEPRSEVVELAGTFEGQPWMVRFTGAFADETACVHVTIAETYEPSCQGRVENVFAGSQPSSDSWVTDELRLDVTSVVPEVVELRFVSDDDAIVPSRFRCAMGPLGWTDPDRKVCVMVLPPNGSGTLEYLDADGDVLFEEGMSWGVSEPEVVVPVPVDPVHGGTYWAVYPWLGAAGSPDAENMSALLLEDFGIEAFPGDLSCDDGAAEALGTDAPQGIGVYFETQGEANDFAMQAGLLGHEADPVIAHVTTYCLD